MKGKTCTWQQTKKMSQLIHIITKQIYLEAHTINLADITVSHEHHKKINKKQFNQNINPR